jgi:hypothetical protein
MRSRCCLCISPIVARQQLGKSPLLLVGNGSVKFPLSLLGNVSVETLLTAVTNTHATIEELLDASFSMWPVSYQGE